MAAERASRGRGILRTRSGSVRHARRSRRDERTLLALLFVGWATITGAASVMAHLTSWPIALPAMAAAFQAAIVAAAVTVWLLSRRAEAWLGTRWLAFGLLATAAVQITLRIAVTASWGPSADDAFASTLALLMIVALGAVVIDLWEHIRGDVIEIVSDVILLAALIGGGTYLVLRGGGGSPGIGATATATATAMTGAIGFGAVLLIAGSAVLALWVPSRVHLALTGATALLGSAGVALAVGRHVALGSGYGALPSMPSVLGTVGLLALAAVVVVEPRLTGVHPKPQRPALWVRPWLLTLSLGGACVWLGVALVGDGRPTSEVESVALIAIVAGMVAARTFTNQTTMARAARDLEDALRQRERAVASLRIAVAEVAASEQRMHLLLDAAVDGIVELDAEDRVVRANGAFCRMVGLAPEEIVGLPWKAVAAETTAEVSLVGLPGTGEAVVRVEGRSVYLEARSSPVPADPPGTLLLVRDVTSSKVAEQTIRTLFQFLQDRDEDRTRYLRRTNAAIEAERNRIARDLHDGPIQGVAAATLSLEAVKLMVGSGQLERAGEMLAKIRSELSQETGNLRRLMSDLRPPLLEERGLTPAVRELCAKFQDHSGVQVTVRSACDAAMPTEVETLAYRVVQEALSNVAKHAQAASVVVRLEGGRGLLEVEVQDDGAGFEPSNAREFLRLGKVGLASMRERTELGAGTLTVRSRPGAGTSVTASLPYELLVSPRT